MLSSFDDLDCGILTDLGRIICRHWHLWQAYTTGIELVRGSDDLEDRLHDHVEVRWQGANTEVDIHECVGVAAEPSRLESYGAAPNGPEGTVVRPRHSSTLRDISVCYKIFGMERMLVQGYIHCIP